MALLENILNLKWFTKEVDGQPVAFQSNEKLLLITIHHCNQRGLRTSYQVLRRYAACSTTTVIRSLNSLLKLGLIQKQTRVDSETGGCLSNSYEIDADLIANLGA